MRELCDKRAAVLAPFFALSGPSRPHAVASALAELMPVDIVTSDFDHARKIRREPMSSPQFESIVCLKTLPYRSNLGPSRLLSHILFSFRAAMYFLRNRGRYDVIYATVPLNLMAWLVFLVMRPAKKIMDVVDIWPDVLPFSNPMRRMFAPLFATWKGLFVAVARRADVAIVVSDAFLVEVAKFVRNTTPLQRFYIGHEALRAEVNKQPQFTIAYVGNLGWLYDFETLLAVLGEEPLRESMQLFVIGEGDRREWLLEELRKRRIDYKYFGIVYEHAKLAEILCSCHAGFNGFLRTTAAFSYKAGSYFAAGLPVINSMPGDLERVIDQYGVGRNYKGGDRERLKEALISLQRTDQSALSARCKSFFESQVDSRKIHEELVKFFSHQLRAVPDGTWKWLAALSPDGKESLHQSASRSGIAVLRPAATYHAGMERFRG